MKRKPNRNTWYRADLHLHTPASSDYQETGVGIIDILRRAEAQGLDILALTDHNTVNGYAGMLRDIDRLSFLQTSNRATPDELRLLNEYRRLLDKLLVLPGFEFTATFGFHILGIFSPSTPIRVLEHLLLSLNVPSHALDAGSSEVGASSDVLTAYRAIYEAGGLCIAAHANSAHGVAMFGVEFGGQTRIAYTQDRHLHALEVTDLTRNDKRSTARFFDGSKPEYPRRMRCIQGSDAHRLDSLRDKRGTVNPGVGERITEFALPERSFEALLELFQGADMTRTRPYQPNTKAQDYVQQARETGASVVTAFHPAFDRKDDTLRRIVMDVCAFLNTNGGTLYIGVSADKKQKPLGVENPKQVMELLEREIRRAITPSDFTVEMDAPETQGKTVLRLQVPFGADRPYAIDQSMIYLRDEDTTNLAVRDEIVTLVRQGLALKADQPDSTATLSEPVAAVMPSAQPTAPASQPSSAPSPQPIEPPRSGVELVNVEERDGTRYYAMHDLRNGNVVQNVTRGSSRLLWLYAIKTAEDEAFNPESVDWRGTIGLIRRYTTKGEPRCDLAQQMPDGATRVYYGVAEAALEGAWEVFAPIDE
ncbi:MAG: putative DNA binding domain-containing protein [Anaerolineae bacterium]|nr:putative DNA binding domain-containing protein [Anaerolineae bacterium]